MTALEEIHHVADIPIYVDVELDRKVMTLREILELDAGSVVRLNRSAGENIDMIVGGTLLGVGEIVILENIMGIRITDLNSEK